LAVERGRAALAVFTLAHDRPIRVFTTMIRMAIECAEQLEDATPNLPYNWATILCLYQQR